MLKNFILCVCVRAHVRMCLVIGIYKKEIGLQVRP